MGVFDTVIVPCPVCGKRAEFQSKSGDCTLRVFDLHKCPPDILTDVNRHSPHTCSRCKTVFEVNTKTLKPIIPKDHFKFNVDDAQLYEINGETERTYRRLVQIAECGMEEVAPHQYGYKGITSGLYLEMVWHYSNADFKDYIDWGRGLILMATSEPGYLVSVGPISNQVIPKNYWFKDENNNIATVIEQSENWCIMQNAGEEEVYVLSRENILSIIKDKEDEEGAD